MRDLFTGVLLCILSGCQAEAVTAERQPEPSAATDAGRRFSGEGRVESDGRPRADLRVARDLPFVGTTSFDLQGRADAEVFYFGSASDGEIERFVQLQFEEKRPDVAGGYTDRGTETVNLAGQEFMLFYWCFDLDDAIAERPDSDIAKVSAWLATKGLRARGEYVGTRLVRLLGDERRAELLLIYGERAGLHGIDCEDEQSAREKLPGLRARALAAVTVDRYSADER